MHKKINVDYFKNKLDKLPQVQLPQVHLPKIKSRKIFSTRSPSENVPPPLPKVPPPTIVDRSPMGISTISALVEGAPKYDYSFGGAEVPQHFVQRHLKEDAKQRDGDPNAKRTRGFSEKFTKHYKELSEFKFKNIFGKKTIVRTTEIQVDMYKKRYEEELDEPSSDQSDYDDFDVHSVPSAGNDRRTSVAISLQSQESTSHIPRIAESVEYLNEIEPIESSLYKIKQRAEINVNTWSDKTPKQPDINSKRSHREVFDSACGKAKKVMNSKFQKLLQIKSKSTQEQPPAAPVVPDRKPTYKVRNAPNLLPRKDSVESSRESLNSLGEDGTDYNPRQGWSSRRILSIDSMETPRCLKSQFSLESSDGEREIIAIRPAPPIPIIPKQENIQRAPNNQIVIAFHRISPSLQRRDFTQDFLKGHSRKPSMDSLDSDSWIPETFRSTRPQIELNKIAENVEPWTTKSRNNFKKLTKTHSIDIFAGDECEKVFDDFDDALKNVPVISIAKRLPPPEVPSPKIERPARPLVKQTSLTKQFSDEMMEVENLNIDVNKLISQFEPNLISSGEKIRVTAVVETNRYQSSEESPVRILTDLIPQERLLRPWENSEPSSLGSTEPERFESVKRRPISAKEWALRVKTSRSLESGAHGSDDSFYSFESGNYDFNACSNSFWSDACFVAHSKTAN